MEGQKQTKESVAAPRHGEGVVVRIQGAVVDVEFRQEVPEVHEALEVRREGMAPLILETEFVLGNGEARTLAMGTTEGLARGARVMRTGGPVAVPTGDKTLGRIFDVLGRTIDGGPALEGD